MGRPRRHADRHRSLTAGSRRICCTAIGGRLIAQSPQCPGTGAATRPIAPVDRCRGGRAHGRGPRRLQRDRDRCDRSAPGATGHGRRAADAERSQRGWTRPGCRRPHDGAWSATSLAARGSRPSSATLSPCEIDVSAKRQQPWLLDATRREPHGLGGHRRGFLERASTLQLPAPRGFAPACGLRVYRWPPAQRLCHS